MSKWSRFPMESEFKPGGQKLKVSADNFDEALRELIEDASRELLDDIEDDVDAYISEDLIPELERLSPERTGKYKKGWRVQTVYTYARFPKKVVYQSEKPSLTHLLEYGHEGPGGVPVPAKPHMRPAFDSTIGRLSGRLRLK